MSGDEKKARVLMRELGHYLISAASGDVDMEDILVELAVPMPADDRPLNFDDSIKLSRIAKREYVQRLQRSRYFGDDLFSDPAWDMLLDLYISKISGMRISVTSLCIASHVAPTTALRWIAVLEQQNLLHRSKDSADNRRTWVELTESGALKMENYLRDVHKRCFEEVDKAAGFRSIYFSDRIVHRSKVNEDG